MSRVSMQPTILSALLALSMTACAGSASAPGDALAPGSRIIVNEIASQYEAGVTKIRVLEPRSLKKGRTYPVVYVLPVEPKDDSQFGDGLTEVEKAGFAERYQAIFVTPTFS